MQPLNDYQLYYLHYQTINLCFTNFRHDIVAEIMLLFYPNESKFCFKVYFSLKYSKVTQTENLGKLLPGVGELFLHIKLSLRSGPLTRLQI